MPVIIKNAVNALASATDFKCQSAHFIYLDLLLLGRAVNRQIPESALVCGRIAPVNAFFYSPLVFGASLRDR